MTLVERPTKHFRIHYPHPRDPTAWDDLYGPELITFAEEGFVGLTAVVRSVFERPGLPIDLILASGNSGSAMVGLIAAIVDRLGARLPSSTLVLPVNRRRIRDPSRLDPSTPGLASHVDELRERFPEAGRTVLFVDDEVHKGRTLQAALRLLTAAHPDWAQAHLTVIAEEQGFRFSPASRLVDSFYAFSEGTPGLHGAVFHFSRPFGEHARTVLLGAGLEAEAKHVCALLLNQPIFGRSAAVADRRLVDLGSGNAELQSDAQRFRSHIRCQVGAALERPYEILMG